MKLNSRRNDAATQTLVFGAVLTFLIAFSTASVQAQTCEEQCIQKAEQCRETANGIYITCGQQGGTEEACKKKKEDYLATCGCSTCSRITKDTPRTGALKTWYCECGEPTDELTCGLTLDGGYSNPCGCDPNDPTCTSPILLDVRGDGFKLTDVARGVLFDLRATGTKIQTAWTEQDSDDAWLALDRNGNGLIDDGSELFGNFTPQPPRVSKNGFLALAEFDKPENGGNADRVLDNRDAIFNRLRLWRDANHNGLSEEPEFFTLPSAAVQTIDLDYNETRRMDQYGNLFRYRAKVNGSRSAWDVFLTHAAN